MYRHYLVFGFLNTIALFIIFPTPAYSCYNKQLAQFHLTQAQISQLTEAVEMYKIDSGFYPTEVEILVKKPFLKKIPLDAWNHPFFYQSNPDSFTIVSGGPDGIYGNKDDIDLNSTPPSGNNYTFIFWIITALFLSTLILNILLLVRKNYRFSPWLRILLNWTILLSGISVIISFILSNLLC